MSKKLPRLVCMLAIVGLVALVYWPAHYAGFVWDDKIIFHDSAWLRSGDLWSAFSFHDFYGWANYFRPTVVALFVAEVQAFGAEPGPMHLVSLTLHLANTLLVGLLAGKLCRGASAAAHPALLPGLPMLLYGLHPALIEPVMWISAQFDLVVTFFMLLGLLLNEALRHWAVRGLAVAACFFLAACTKESAISFPLLLALFDWMRMDAPLRRGFVTELRAVLRQRWATYVLVLCAGIAYLALRFWALGVLVHPAGGQSMLSLAFWQTVSFTYLTFWRIVIWPMFGLGPTHVVDTGQFATLSAAMIATDIAALAILVTGLHYSWKRTPLGWLVLGVTIALLPALHVVPVAFNSSLYHERYAMLAVGAACALVPRILSLPAFSASLARWRGIRLALPLFALAWLVLAAVNIRVTLPLWSEETKLWLWALREHPQSVEAKDHLLSTYLEQNDRKHARQLADILLADKQPCMTCMINIANLALGDGDTARATTALERARDGMRPGVSKRSMQAYDLAIGQLLELENDIEGAEAAYRGAISLEPLDPRPQMALALMLARQGRTHEAYRQADIAFSLLTPDERAAGRREFESVLIVPARPSLLKPTQ